MNIAGQSLARSSEFEAVAKHSLQRDLASGMFIVAILAPITEQLFSGSPIYDATIFMNLGFIILALIINKFNVPFVAIRIALPFVLLCALGLVSAAEGVVYYDVVKDVWYVMNPCVAVLTGFFLGYLINDFRRLILCTFVAGLTFASFHVVQFALNPSIIKESLRSLRQDAGLGEFTSALCLGILFTLSWNKIPWRRISLPICLVVLPICLASQVLGLSRIWWVCLIVICFSATGFLHLRRFPVWVAPSLVAVSLALAVPFLLPVSSMEQSGTTMQVQVKTAGSQGGSQASRFAEKIQNSLHEITPHDFTNMTEINENWRGYESYRGMKYYNEGTWSEMLFGHGYGVLTDLGIVIKLKDSIFRVTPWFHNGYVYLLVKTGLLGLIFYLSFVFIIVRYGMQGYDSNSKVIRSLSRILVGSAMSLMLATAVFAGAFNRSRFVSALVFIGATVALQRRLLVREAALSQPRRGGVLRFGRTPVPSTPVDGAAAGLSPATSMPLTTSGQQHVV